MSGAEDTPIILPEDGDDGAIYFDPKIRTLEARSDIDEHSNIKADDLGEHLGDGFFINPEPVLVERGLAGEIVRTTPLSEIPGVQMHGAGLDRIDQEDKATPVKLSREERSKLVDSLTLKLFKYYKSSQSTLKAFNPFRDGIPEVADADPLNLSPGKSEAVVMNTSPTETEIFMWLRKFVGARASIVDKKQGFGAHDLALRIERNPD